MNKVNLSTEDLFYILTLAASEESHLFEIFSEANSFNWNTSTILKVLTRLYEEGSVSFYKVDLEIANQEEDLKETEVKELLSCWDNLNSHKITIFLTEAGHTLWDSNEWSISKERDELLFFHPGINQKPHVNKLHENPTKLTLPLVKKMPKTTAKTIDQILTCLFAAVWFINGFFCKILNFTPRHQLIVSEILGEEHAAILTKLIGAGEVFLAIWILSKIWQRLNTWIQILLVLTMNLIEFNRVPDMLLWGQSNLLFALAFSGLLYWKEFILRPKSQ